MSILRRCGQLVVLLAGCGDDATPMAIDAGPDARSGGDACACELGLPQRAGAISITGANELSGLTASRSLVDTLWTHNDSGDTARLFAITTTGATRGIATITGATATDWEDIASGTCDGAPCVVVADIGDNDLERPSVQLYEIDEPAAITGPIALAARRFDITYPGGPANSEALVVDPRDNAAYVITKVTTNPAIVYRMPRSAGGPAVAEQVGTLSLPGTLPRVTAADLFRDACGTRLLVRTYTGLFELRGGPDATIASLLAMPLEAVPVASEPQGEAVAFLRDGRGYVTVSEGTAPALERVTCP